MRFGPVAGSEEAGLEAEVSFVGANSRALATLSSSIGRANQPTLGRDSINPDSPRIRSASRKVARLTPNWLINSLSGGNCDPGARLPSNSEAASFPAMVSANVFLGMGCIGMGFLWYGGQTSYTTGYNFLR
jgi:hypothetical protein